MPRQSRSGGGSRAPPSRPTVPQRQVAPQQIRPATTAAHPPATMPQAPPPVQQGSGAGSFLGNVAQTAAGVAAGHAITNMIFGGRSSEAAPEQAQQNAVANNTQGNEQSSWGQKACDADVKQFTTCMNENQGNMQICGWYLEQLKACQQAASQY